MEYPLHQLIQLGRLEIHISLSLISNPTIDVSLSGSKKGHCQRSLYDLVLRELKPRCSRAMHVSQEASLKRFFFLFVGVNLLYNYEFFLRAAFVEGLFPVAGDIPFICEFFGRQRLIKEI